MTSPTATDPRSLHVVGLRTLMQADIPVCYMASTLDGDTMVVLGVVVKDSATAVSFSLTSMYVRKAFRGQRSHAATCIMDQMLCDLADKASSGVAGQKPHTACYVDVDPHLYAVPSFASWWNSIVPTSASSISNPQVLLSRSLFASSLHVNSAAAFFLLLSCCASASFAASITPHHACGI